MNQIGPIAAKLKQRLQIALHNHQRVQFIRLKMSYPAGYPVTDNSKFQSFIENYRRYLSRHGLDPHYVWLTETDNNQISHQLSLLVNADAVYADFNISKVRELWCYTIGILPLNCERLVTCIQTNPGNRLSHTNGIIARDDNYAISEMLQLVQPMDAIVNNTTSNGLKRYACSLIPDIFS